MIPLHIQCTFEMRKNRRTEEVIIFSTVDLGNLRSRVHLDATSYQIRDLCKHLDDNKIEITLFQLTPPEKEVLPILGRVRESLTFQALWKEYGLKAQSDRNNDKAQKQHLSLSDVVENVCKPAFKSWTKNVAGVKDGTTSLGDVDKLFDDYRNRKSELEGELSCMFKVNKGQTTTNVKELNKTVRERVAQIQRYQQLHQYSNAADTIWEFKEAMGFTGDFKVIEDLRNQVS